MPIDIYWKTENKETVVIEFHGVWTWEEYQIARKQTLHPMLDEVNHPVDHIYSLIHSDEIPSNTFTQIARIANSHHPNFSKVLVVVGARHIVRTILKVANNVYLKRREITLYTASTLDEAVSLLNSVATSNFTPKITVEPYQNKSDCFLWTFQAGWRFADYKAALQQFNEAFFPLADKVTIIVKLEKAMKMRRIFEMMLYGFQHYPTRQIERVIVVGNLGYWQNIYNVFTYMYGDPEVSINFVATIDELQSISIEAARIPEAIH